MLRLTPKDKIRTKAELAIVRLRAQQDKKSAVSKQQRREIAQLLEKGKEVTARIRVEAVIRDDNTIELWEILEQYCEIIKTRYMLLDAHPWESGLAEAIRAVNHCAEHFRREVKELVEIKAFLDAPSRKFKQEDQGEVPARILKKLSLEPPPAELVELYLQEIARTYGVRWGPEPKTDSDDDQPSGGIGEPLPVFVETEEQPGAVASSPIRVLPPHPTTDNPVPKIKLAPHMKVAKPTPKPEPKAAPKQPGDIDPDDLEARFAALQKW